MLGCGNGLGTTEKGRLQTSSPHLLAFGVSKEERQLPFIFKLCSNSDRGGGWPHPYPRSLTILFVPLYGDIIIPFLGSIFSSE